MPRKDGEKSVKLTVHEQSAALREKFSGAVESGTPQDFIVPVNVFAMTFATSSELLEQLKEGKISVVFEMKDNKVHIVLVRAIGDKQVNFSRALTDHGYRNSLLEQWYKQLCGAYQNSDDEKAEEIASVVLSQSAIPLGLVGWEEGQPITMFDLQRPDLRQTYAYHLKSMQRLYETGGLNTPDRIYSFLSSIWDVIGGHDLEKRQSIDVPLDSITSAAAGSAKHAW